MSNYKDRGILKWAPFDALSSQKSILEDLIYNLEKKDKSILSEDENEELNETIKKALQENKNVSIDYYNDGYVYSTYGKIKKINSVKKIIIMDTEEEIYCEDILEIKITR